MFVKAALKLACVCLLNLKDYLTGIYMSDKHEQQLVLKKFKAFQKMQTLGNIKRS